MTIQFLDLRLSMNRNQAGGTQTLGTTPILLGDIGIQTAAADGTANEGDVRVALMGTIGFGAAGNNAILITVERDSTDTPGTGTLIYSGAHSTTAGATSSLVSFNAADFPPAAAVDEEIRYTMFVAASTSSPGTVVTVVGPVVFNGIAAAGTTTS
jgi:hypothetical protein